MTENQRMKAVRKALKMNQGDFGKHLGISYAAVSMAERELNNVSEQNIRAMVREFRVNEHWLRTGEGDMFLTVLPENEIMASFGDIMNSGDLFKIRFISAIAKLTPNEWELLKNKIIEIAGDINKTAQE